MLKKLRIQNFKLWKDTGTIDMAPITLFFGANSSGKSSIGQFLMMLKQTIEFSDRKTVFYPGGKNSAVQLGSYHEMVFQRNNENRIMFEYQWELQDILKFTDHFSDHPFTGDNLSFEAKVGLRDKGQHSLVVDLLRYQLFSKNKSTVSIGMKRKSITKDEYGVEATNYVLKRKLGRVWSPGAPVRFYGFPDEVVAYHQNADFVQALNLKHEKLFSLLNYLGPLRTKAERLYSWTGIEPESVGYAGENTIAAILAARNRKISFLRRGAERASPARPFEEIIAQKLKEMGLIDAFKVTPISEQRQEYEVKIKTRGSMYWVDIPDAGFGISQVLPVLVQCFYAPIGSIILIEQPEIHLHPSAQSALADVVIDVINSRVNKIGRNIQLIIETHSEHFLRRLQRRIAEGVVPKEMVSAYFATINKASADLERLYVDLFGNIENWPDNFFGDEMGDILKQTKATMTRRMNSGINESEG